MARIRSIKPDFFTSEQIAECSTNARLLFIGLWCFADDSGVHPNAPSRIKMEIFPADSFTKNEVAAMVAELIQASLLLPYSVQDVEYVQITGWRKHQRIDQPSYKHPLPDGKIPANVRRTGSEHSSDSATNVQCGNGVDRSIKSKSKEPGSRRNTGATA